MKRILLTLAILLVLPSMVSATDYYVTQDGGGADYSAAQFNALLGDYSGDTFYFSGAFTTRITPKVWGTAAGQVVLDGYHAGDCDPLNSECTSSAYLNEGMHVGNGNTDTDYVTAQDFRMTMTSSNSCCFSFYGNLATDYLDHIIVQRNYVFYPIGCMFYMYQAGEVILKGNKFVHFGKNGGDAVQGVNFIDMDHMLVSGNEFGIDSSLYPSGSTSANTIELHGVHYLLFENNNVYFNHATQPQTGSVISPKEGWDGNSDQVYRFNKIHTNPVGAGLNIGGGSAPHFNFYVYGNMFYDTTNALTAYDDVTYDIYIWANILHDDTHRGFLTWQRGPTAARDVHFYNNVISRTADIDSDYGRSGLTLGAGGSYNMYFKNNIFNNNRPSGKGDLYHQVWEDAIDMTLDYNTYYHSLTANDDSVDFWYYDNAYRNLPEIKALGQEANGKIRDPVFNDPDGADNTHGTDDDDYTLKSLSDEIDAGADLSQCFYVDISGGDSWFEAQTGYSTETVCLSDALHPSTDWTTTPPTVITANQNDYGQWERGAYVYTGPQDTCTDQGFYCCQTGFTCSDPRTGSGCGAGETCCASPSECIQDPNCGDGTCDPGECDTCPQDCTFDDCCEDGTCNNEETCSSCPQDCLSQGEVCCLETPYNGNCCDDSDCTLPQTCSNHICSEGPNICDRISLLMRFDEDSLIAKDSSGNGNDGTVNGPTFTSGISNGAFSFDGVDDYVDAGSDSSLKPTEAVTTCAWVILAGDGGGDYPQIIGGSSAEGYELDYYETDDKFQFWVYDGDWGTPAESIDTYTSTGWIHLCGVYDRVSPKLYINGVKQTDGVNTGSISYASGNIYIGDGDNENFNGIIDNVAIWNRALTSDEIQDLYQRDALYCLPQDFHRVDTTTPFGCISMAELVEFIDQWKYDSTAYPMSELMEAVVLYYSPGAGC